MPISTTYFTLVILLRWGLSPFSVLDFPTLPQLVFHVIKSFHLAMVSQFIYVRDFYLLLCILFVTYFVSLQLNIYRRTRICLLVKTLDQRLQNLMLAERVRLVFLAIILLLLIISIYPTFHRVSDFGWRINCTLILTSLSCSDGEMVGL